MNAPPLASRLPPPTVHGFGPRGSVVTAPGGPFLQRHERAGDWVLMACTDLDGERVAVFEQHPAEEELSQVTGPTGATTGCSQPWRLAYVGPEGTRLELTKSLVATRVDEEGCYGENTKRMVRASRHDVLRKQLLATDGDPTREQVANLFPPIRRARPGGAEIPHTFVGSPESYDVVPVFYNPVTAKPRVQPLAVSVEMLAAIESETLYEGLVGGWLPAALLGYPVDGVTRWESLTFGVPSPPSPHLQPVWYRYMKITRGDVVEAHYFDSELPYPLNDEPSAGDFYRALAHLYAYWHDRLAGGMRVEAPEEWVPEFCLHSMALEMITRVGDHPRYGVVDRAYGGPEHDGFQDILTSAATCYMEWGHFEVARRYLHQYLTVFVRPDGGLRYRGPEMGQYGRMLTVLARFYELTGDESFLLQHQDKVSALCEVLLGRRRQALSLGRGHIAYGLIRGRHEADMSFDTPGLLEHDYEQPYFSNSAEAGRGLLDLGKVWRSVGRSRGDAALAARGASLIEEGLGLSKDVARAVDRSWVDRQGVATLPLFVGATALHRDAPYRSRPESFDENRVWSEMLYSGLLGRETAERILNSAADNGDSTLGIFGNRDLVVAFTAYGQAYAMVQHDLIREFLLLYYAHASHLHTRGTWSAFECVDMDRDRAAHLPYCAPAQLVVPTLTKWMLVFDDPVVDELWLAKAVPRAWLADGRHLVVTEAPTRWGPVSYEVRSSISSYRVEVDLSLPESREGPVQLRLRAPGGRRLRGVQVNGRPWGAFDPVLETVGIPPDGPSRASFTCFYH